MKVDMGRVFRFSLRWAHAYEVSDPHFIFAGWKDNGVKDAHFVFDGKLSEKLDAWHNICVNGSVKSGDSLFPGNEGWPEPLFAPLPCPRPG